MDVQELLEAGISVLSAFNIQHLESVHDIVAQITNVKVRERIQILFYKKQMKFSSLMQHRKYFGRG